jgi:hypothetical protein
MKSGASGFSIDTVVVLIVLFFIFYSDETTTSDRIRDHVKPQKARPDLGKPSSAGVAAT